MYALSFGLFSLALIFIYGMVHTFYLVKKMKQDVKSRKKYVIYGSKLGLYGCLSFLLGIVVYIYGGG